MKRRFHVIFGYLHQGKVWATGLDTLDNLVPWMDDKMYYIVLYDYPPQQNYNFSLYNLKL